MVAVKSGDAARASARPDPACRVILFFGPDSGLVSERARSLSLYLLGAGHDPLQLVRLDGDTLGADPMRLVDEANTIGLFGGQRVIWISPTSKNLASAVEPLLATPPLDSRVIIEGGDLSKTNPLRVSIERAKTALAIPCYGDDGRSLGDMIDTMVREAKLELPREARTLLVESLGSDRMISRQEVEKLILHAWGTSRIAENDIALLIGDSATREISTLVDAAFAGKLAAIDAALQRLFAENTDPAQILGGLLRHALTLIPVRMRIDQGEVTREAARNLRGMPFPRLVAAEQALNQWQVTQLLEVVRLTSDATGQTRREAALAQAICSRATWMVARMAGRSSRAQG
jgi:DNA polymerase III subunit delta